MNEEKKEWVVVRFPQGPFQGTVNVAISGEWVVSANTAKELMENMDKETPLTLKV